MLAILFSSLLVLSLLMDSCGRSNEMVIVKNNRGERVALGQPSAKALLDSFPDFKRNYERYQVEDSVLTELKRLDQELEIFTVLGTWCKDSRREVPRFLKIMDALDSEKIRLKFFGVDRSKRDKAGIAESHDIRYVPTFILKENGKEIGRIIERPKKTLEVDLTDILRKHSGNK